MWSIAICRYDTVFVCNVTSVIYPAQAASNTRCVFYDVEVNGGLLLHQHSEQFNDYVIMLQ